MIEAEPQPRGGSQTTEWGMVDCYRVQVADLISFCGLDGPGMSPQTRLGKLIRRIPKSIIILMIFCHQGPNFLCGIFQSIHPSSHCHREADAAGYPSIGLDSMATKHIEELY